LQQMAEMGKQTPLCVRGVKLGQCIGGRHWMGEKMTQFKLKHGWKPYAADWRKGENSERITPSVPYIKIFSKCMMKHFLQMYDEAYKAMETAGVAVRYIMQLG
jgi:hypothetical protein